MPDEETFQVACPRCGDTFDVPISLLGKKAQCPGCGAKFAMEPPPGPLGREIMAKAARAAAAPVEPASATSGSVHIPLRGAAKPAASRPSTNTVKLARFKPGASATGEKLASVQAQQQAPKIQVNPEELQKELAKNAAAPHRRVISSGVQPQAPTKKWWEFWK